MNWSTDGGGQSGCGLRYHHSAALQVESVRDVLEGLQGYIVV